MTTLRLPQLFRSGSALAAAFILHVTGCAPAADDGEPEVDEAQAMLESMGYAPSRVEFEGDTIRLDGDFILSREKLLNGEYQPSEESDGEEEKGWRWFTVGAAYRANIKLAWATGSETPTTAIKNAFIAAAGAITGVPFCAIDINTANTGGETITVHMIDGFLWPKAGTCGAGTVACAIASVGGKPSKDIYIKSVLNNDPPSQPCNWTTSSLSAITLHEMGHAIGLGHTFATGANDANHVGTTQWCTNPNQALCDKAPGYATIMKAPTFAWPACTEPYTSLQPDDQFVLDALY